MDSHQVEGLQRCPSRGSTLSTPPVRHATEGVGRQAAYGRKSRLTDDDLAAHFVDAGSQLVLLQRKGDLVLGQLALLFAAPDLLQPASPVCAGGELSQGYVPGPVIPMLMPHQTITVGGIGHRHLEARGEFPHVQLCFHRVLSELARRFPRLKAVSALATGADTVFAQCAKNLSIPLESVIPFANFEADFADQEPNARYHSLRSSAVHEHRLHFSERNNRAYKKSMEWVVFKSNILVAAWDGRHAGSLGGTWEAISLCGQLGKTLIHVDTANKTLNLHVGRGGTSATLKEVSFSQIMRQL